MPQPDRQRWNQRYADMDYEFRPTADLQIVEPLLGHGGSALDLACGGGRNAFYLADLGYTVTAWDLSDMGLRILQTELERRRRDGWPGLVYPQQVDLEQAPWPTGEYDLVICCFFVFRPLFAAMRRWVRPGGLVFVVSYLDSDTTRRRGVRPEHKLQPGELRAQFPGWTPLRDVEDPERGVALLLARRPATR